MDKDLLQFVPDTRPAKGPRRVSYHSSGRVNYGSFVSSPPRFFEPLFDITQRNHFFFISIPSVDRLDPITELPSSTGGITECVWDVPPPATGRIAFELVIAPIDDDGQDLVTHLRLGYDTFALFVTAVPLPFPIPDDMKLHFIFAASAGLADTQFCGHLEAELAYHQKRTDHKGAIIYGPDGRGVYTLFPSVVMRIQPKLSIEFTDKNLKVEVVDEGSRANRIRFRIRGKGGYVTDKDLRPLVRSVELDAEL